VKALLLLAHGSRSKQSNIEIANLVNSLREKCSEHFSIIHFAFLEISNPSIPEGIQLCVADGSTSILVLPYFLNSGRHVLEDIPNRVNEIKKSYPNVAINTSPHIGASELMEEIIMSSIKEYVK
jgi:sirohydrochlorin ferrochelatase